MSVRVSILGCGPAGLAAAYAAEVCGADVTIWSRPVRGGSEIAKSSLYGAQSLKSPLPGLFDSRTSLAQGVVFSYLLAGSVQGYLARVYGRERATRDAPAVAATEALTRAHRAWDVRAAYDLLWERFQHRIHPMTLSLSTEIVGSKDRVEPRLGEGAALTDEGSARGGRPVVRSLPNPDGAARPKHLADPDSLQTNERVAEELQTADMVISSVPAPLICESGGTCGFETGAVWAAGSAPDQGRNIDLRKLGVAVPPNTVVYNGEPDYPGTPRWSRVSVLFDYTTVEWPVNPGGEIVDKRMDNRLDNRIDRTLRKEAERAGAVLVEKPLITDCKCHPDWLMVGRYGRWAKDELVHHAYWRTLDALHSMVLYRRWEDRSIDVIEQFAAV